MRTNTIGKIREKKDTGLYENMQIFQEIISKYPKYSNKKKALKHKIQDAELSKLKTTQQH